MATEKGMTIAENKYNSYKASTPKIPEANKVSKQGNIGLSQQGAQTYQNGQVSKNNANVNQGQKYGSNEKLGQQASPKVAQNVGNKQANANTSAVGQQNAPVKVANVKDKSGVSQGIKNAMPPITTTVSNNKKVGDLISYAEEDGYEVYYRTMSLENYESFKKTGKIPSTGETFISPTQNYSEENYNGVLVKFKVKKGTTEKLMNIGVRNKSKTLADEFPDMNESEKGWGKNHAQFKEEKGQVNIGLGKEKALDTFNENIVESEVINLNNKKGGKKK